MNDNYINFDEQYEKLQEENVRLKQWINDLQSGQYVNCVYCGHRYGPENSTPVSKADQLKAHIEQCPEHPMSKMKNLLYIACLKMDCPAMWDTADFKAMAAACGYKQR